MTIKENLNRHILDVDRIPSDLLLTDNINNQSLAPDFCAWQGGAIGDDYRFTKRDDVVNLMKLSKLS